MLCFTLHIRRRIFIRKFSPDTISISHFHFCHQTACNFLSTEESVLIWIKSDENLAIHRVNGRSVVASLLRITLLLQRNTSQTHLAEAEIWGIYHIPSWEHSQDVSAINDGFYTFVYCSSFKIESPIPRLLLINIKSRKAIFTAIWLFPKERRFIYLTTWRLR